MGKGSKKEMAKGFNKKDKNMDKHLDKNLDAVLDKVWMEIEKTISLDKDSPKATMPEMNIRSSSST